MKRKCQIIIILMMNIDSYPPNSFTFAMPKASSNLWYRLSACVINTLKKIASYILHESVFGSAKTRRFSDEQTREFFYTQASCKHLHLLTEDLRKIEGVWFDKQSKKTAIVFTGSHRSYEFFSIALTHAYLSHGYNVLTINYGGFGKSDGSPSKHTLEKDAEVAYACAYYLNPKATLLAHGYSLGSYPACYIASKKAIPTLVVDRGFSHMPAVVYDHAKIKFNTMIAWIARLLCKLGLNLDNARHLKSFKGRVVAIHAKQDEIFQAYHMDRIEKACSNLQKFQIEGSHLHQNLEPIWFQDSDSFWNAL